MQPDSIKLVLSKLRVRAWDGNRSRYAIAAGALGAAFLG